MPFSNFFFCSSSFFVFFDTICEALNVYFVRDIQIWLLKARKLAMKRKAIFATTLIVGIVLVLLLGNYFIWHRGDNERPKYKEYTSAHSLTKKYTKNDYKLAVELIGAIHKKDANQVSLLIKKNKQINCPQFEEDPNSDMPAPFTPLSAACNIGDYETAKMLVAQGAVANVRDTYSPLELALDQYEPEDLDLVKLLVANGENVRKSIYLDDVAECRNFNYNTENDNQRIVDIYKYLEGQGAQMSSKGKALSNAAYMGNTSLAKFLIEERGADVNHETIATPLIRAVYAHTVLDEKTVEMVKMLLEHGADRNYVYALKEPPVNYGTALDIVKTYPTPNQELIKLLEN